VGSTPIPHAFRFDGTNLIDLGAGIVGSGINDLDQIVGGSSAGAFLNDGSTTIDLNTLVASISGWTLQDAKDINNLGQIVGTGLLNGEQHGFLLTPTAVPLPAAAWLFGSAIAAFIGVGKRKQCV
jgi:probable HAF family extracellular repeat protein